MDIMDLVIVAIAWFQGFTFGIIVGWIWYYRRLISLIKELEG